MTINVENGPDRRNLNFKVVETKPLTRTTTFITKKQKKVTLEVVQDNNKVQLLTKNYFIKENILKLRIDDFDNMDKLKSHLKAQWTAPEINFGSEEEYSKQLKEDFSAEESKKTPSKNEKVVKEKPTKKEAKKTVVNKTEYKYNFREMDKGDVCNLLREWNIQFDIRAKKPALVKLARTEIKRRKSEE